MFNSCLYDKETINSEMTISNRVTNMFSTINLDLFSEYHYNRVLDGFDNLPKNYRLKILEIGKFIYFTNLLRLMTGFGYSCEIGYMKFFGDRKLIKITDTNSNITTIHFLKERDYTTMSMEYYVYKNKIDDFKTIEDNFIMN